MDAPFPTEMVPCIEQFLANDHSRLAGLDLYPEVFHSDHFFPLQRMRETEAMIRIARDVSPQTVMEIGADKGGGLYHWCKCLPTVMRVIGCEVRGLPYASLFERAFPGINFCWMPCSSYEPITVQSVTGWMTQYTRWTPGIDVLFIDGDKGRFLEDFDAYLPLMSPHGIVFMHDIQDEAPREAFLKVRERGYRCEAIIDTSEAEGAGVRHLRGDPVTSPYEGWLRHWRGRSCGVGVIYMKGAKR